MTDPKLELYYGPGSSSMAAHIALWETGVDFIGRPISFLRKDHRTPEYLAINPAGQVPTSLIDGRPLTEVAAILFYLARQFPDTNLLPQAAEAQARVISWMSFIASTVHPARRQGWEHVRAIYALVECKLDMQPWAIEHYSVADIHLFRLYWRTRNAFEPEPDEFPGLESHYHRMMARPAVQRTCEIENDIGYELAGWRAPSP